MRRKKYFNVKCPKVKAKVYTFGDKINMKKRGVK